jgi:hypothetical protein
VFDHLARDSVSESLLEIELTGDLWIRSGQLAVSRQLRKLGERWVRPQTRLRKFVASQVGWRVELVRRRHLGALRKTHETIVHFTRSL